MVLLCGAGVRDGKRAAGSPAPRGRTEGESVPRPGTRWRERARLRGRPRQAPGAQPIQERPIRQPARTAPEEPAGIAAPGDHQVRGGSKQLVNKSAGADPRATKMLIDGRAAVRPDRGESR